MNDTRYGCKCTHDDNCTEHPSDMYGDSRDSQHHDPADHQSE